MANNVTYYISQGDGHPIVLLHGNGEDSTYFVHQIEEFSKKYRVIALDTRGHGKTPRGDAPFTIRQFVKDLADFFAEHHLEHAHVLGFSDGANIAMIFAMEHPELVDCLILNGGNLNGNGVKTSVQLPIVIGYKIASLFAAKSEEARRHAELLGLMVNDPNIEWEELKKIQARTLVIAGTNDMIKDSHTKHIAAGIPNAKLAVIEGDHFVANKNAKEFNRVVMEFLGE